MMLYDSYPHSIYRVVIDFSGSTIILGGKIKTYPRGRVWINVKASSPTAAAKWAMCEPGLCRIPPSDYMALVTAYKIRRQPVWLKKAGTLTARFDLRRLEKACP